MKQKMKPVVLKMMEDQLKKDKLIKAKKD